MNKSLVALLGSLAALALSSTVALAQPQNQQTQSSTAQTQSSTTKKSSATKKAATNPKKPAEAKEGGDPDKVKTDERMSTRGLKPPPKNADKDKQAKPENQPKQ